jgi:hypothetical protein
MNNPLVIYFLLQKYYTAILSVVVFSTIHTHVALYCTSVLHRAFDKYVLYMTHSHAVVVVVALQRYGVAGVE